MEENSTSTNTKKGSNKMALFAALFAVCGFIVLAGALGAFAMLKDSGIGTKYDGVKIPGDFETYNEGGIKFGYPKDWQAEGAFEFVGAGPKDEKDSEDYGVLLIVSEDEGIYNKAKDQKCGDLEYDYDFHSDPETKVDVKTSKKVEVNGVKGCVFEATFKSEEDGKRTLITYYLADSKDAKRVAMITGYFKYDVSGEEKDNVREVSRTFEFTEKPEDDGLNLNQFYDDFGTLDSQDSGSSDYEMSD